jgi:uncharacterized membrane protein
MLRTILVLAVTMVVLLFSASGCKKASRSPETSEEPVKTSAEYEAEAKEDINEENMNQELDKLEKELQLEAEQTP